MNFFIKFFLHFLIIFLSAAWILLYCPGFFEINKIPETLTTSQQCPEVLTGIYSPEDMVSYNGALLVSSRNLFGLQQGKQDSIENGAIYGYYPRISSIKPNKLEKVKLINFPKNKKFYPFGMKLYNKKLLYVMNQSLRKKEGELIEVFSILETKENKIELQYMRTIKLPDYLVGTINNLAVLSENEVFVSQHLATKYTFINFFVQLFNLKTCGIYYCKIENNQSQCYKQNDINSITAFNNGLWIQELPNQMKRLLVSLTMEKQIGVFIIRQNGDNYGKIGYSYAVDINGYPDNIVFDQERESFFVGAMVKPFELGKLLGSIDENYQLTDDVKAWGQVSIIKNSFYANELQAEIVVQLNDLIRTISVAVRIDDKLYLGSAFDNRILVCNMNELFETE